MIGTWYSIGTPLFFSRRPGNLSRNFRCVFLKKKNNKVLFSYVGVCGVMCRIFDGMCKIYSGGGRSFRQVEVQLEHYCTYKAVIYSFFAPRLKDLGGQKNSAIDRRKWKNQNDRYLTTTRLPITPPLCRQPSCLLFSNPTFTRSSGLYLGNAGRGRRHESEFLTDAFPPLFSSLIHLLLFRGKAKASRAISILGPALYYLYSKKRGPPHNDAASE